MNAQNLVWPSSRFFRLAVASAVFQMFTFDGKSISDAQVRGAETGRKISSRPLQTIKLPELSRFARSYFVYFSILFLFGTFFSETPSDYARSSQRIRWSCGGYVALNLAQFFSLSFFSPRFALLLRVVTARFAARSFFSHELRFFLLHETEESPPPPGIRRYQAGVRAHS